MPIFSAGRTSRTQAAGLRNEAGVTLIEMLVVVGIIGIIAAITAPSVASGLDAVRMASATQSVAAFINGAVNRAERRQEPIELVISVRENKFTMYSNDPAFVRELKLPDGIAIDAVLPVEEEAATGIRRLILMPGASVPGIAVQLINRRGGKRRVKLDPMTGFPRTEIVKPQ